MVLFLASFIMSMSTLGPIIFANGTIAAIDFFEEQGPIG